MLGNWIYQTTTTTGTGALSLTPVTGLPAFSTQFAASESFQYAILDDATGAPFERGIGYLDGSGNLVRAKPLATMTGGTYSGAPATAFNLAAGTKRVICAASSHSHIGAAPGVWSATYKGYGDAHVLGSSGSAVMVADRAYAIPFRAGADSDIDGIVISCTNVGAGTAQAKAAIFSYGDDGLPGVKLAESAAVALSTVTRYTLSFTRVRPPPAFFGCILVDGAVTLMGYSTAMSLTHAMGFNGSLIPFSFVREDGATGLTFPAIWTPVGELSNIARPAMVAKCVS